MPPMPPMPPMPTSCPFRNVFGAPRTGVHSVRAFDVAIVDVLATLAVAYAIARFTGASFTVVAVAAFSAGVVAHRAFCVDTTVDRALARAGF